MKDIDLYSDLLQSTWKEDYLTIKGWQKFRIDACNIELPCQPNKWVLQGQIRLPTHGLQVVTQSWHGAACEATGWNDLWERRICKSAKTH